MTYVFISGDELYHHGIKGQKWGVRRFQNADGSLKPAGEKRYTEGGKESLGTKASKFIKKRKENLENYSNYKKLQQKASKKYDLKDKEYQKQYEDWANDEINKTIFGENYKSKDHLRDLKFAGDKAAKDYEKASKKAEKYVERKFKEKYGEEKLNQARKTESYVLGTEFVALMGLGVGAMLYSSKK